MRKYDELVRRLKRLKVPVTSFGTTTGWTEHPDAHEAATAITTLESELAAMKARGDGLAEALGAVKASMANGGDGLEGDYGWNITRLNRARPLIRQVLAEWRDQ